MKSLYKLITIKNLVRCLVCFCLISCNSESGQKITLVVEAGDYDRQDCIVSTELSNPDITPGQEIQLYEIVNGKKQKTGSQLYEEKGQSPKLYWILDGKTAAGTKREFLVVVMESENSSTGTPVMKVEDTNKALILKKGNNNILQYNYAVTYPPEGINEAYKRSGYLHPAYSPKGNVLTTIQPKDHYHHYGIWNPWTRMLYDDTMYDLWNLADKQGTVRAAEIEGIWQGDVFSGYRANLEHYIFKPEEEKLIMDEKWDIKAWNIPEGYVWDFESYLSPSTDLPVILKEYRYAGFGYRATEEWTRENSVMYTSEGYIRQQIDGSNARWVFVTGDINNGRSGLLFMGHPDNYNYPEPLRIWDENANGGRGDVFINFAPTKNMDWELKPNQTYNLRYRAFAYDGEMTPERAERMWQEFAHPPVVRKK